MPLYAPSGGGSGQPLDAELTALAGVTSAADTVPYFTGSGAAAVTTLSSFARTLIDDADAATARTTVGLGNVTNTSDANKPVSTAQQTALDLKASLAATPTGDLAGTSSTYAAPVIGDLAITARKLSDFARTGGWLPTGAIAETVPHRIASTSLTPTSQQLILVGGIVVPGGRTVSSISFVAANAGSGYTNQWFAIYDRATLGLLATTVDDGATAWGTSAIKTLLLATALRGSTPGGTWTPTNATEVYLACLQNGTVATLRAVASNAAPVGLTPIIAGTSTGSITNLASAPGTAGALTAVANIPYAYVS